MRIIFMGTPDYAVEILKTLHNDPSHEIVGIFTQPDRPVGRKRVLSAPPVKLWQLSNAPKIPIYQPNNLKEERTLSILKDLQPDMIVVAAFGQILPEAVLKIAPCMNLHASLLPKYRGASPIQHAILAQDKYTGVTSMLMDRGLDTGKILGFAVVPIGDTTTSVELFTLLAKKASSLTIKTLESWNTILPIAQKQALSSYAPKITKQDGKISLNNSSNKIYAHYRALTPWPGIFLENGMKILECRLSPYETDKKIGTIIKLEDLGAHIACKEGALFISRVQMPSKKPLKMKDFLQGQRRSVGDLLF